ncbi:DUF4225 domain-containing protein, partial [Pseudomonas syringae]
MAHGANNVYENGRNLWEGRSDTEGPVRKGYQAAAKAVGYEAREGNLAYGSADLAMSVYGVTKLVLKPDSWRLFRYIRTDCGFHDTWTLSPRSFGHSFQAHLDTCPTSTWTGSRSAATQVC